jgi:hypothetical protein
MTKPQNVNVHDPEAQTSTLERNMRARLLSEAEEKRQTLLQMHYSEDISGGQLRESTDADTKALAALPWPKADIEVKARFKSQLAPGMCTGFSIGDHFVVTAAHAFEDQGHPRLTGAHINAYYAVFGLTPAMLSANNIPSVKVFGIKRWVFSPQWKWLAQKDYRLIYRGFDPEDVPWPSDLPPRRENWAGVQNPQAQRRISDKLFYDCAVLELQPLSNGQRMNSSLALSSRPPMTETPVFMIGSPSGLSLKYVANGRVLNEVDPPVNPPVLPLRSRPVTLYGSTLKHLNRSAG